MNSTIRQKTLKKYIEDKGHTGVKVFWETLGPATEMCGPSGGFFFESDQSQKHPLGLSFNEAVQNISCIVTIYIVKFCDLFKYANYELAVSCDDPPEPKSYMMIELDTLMITEQDLLDMYPRPGSVVQLSEESQSYTFLAEPIVDSSSTAYGICHWKIKQLIRINP